MMVEWPVAASGSPSATGPAARARAAANPFGPADRITAARADFFLDPAHRLTDQERALMTRMLRGLVAGIADEWRVAMPAASSDAPPAHDHDPDTLVAALTGAGLLQSDALIALLLRRADAARIADASRPPPGKLGPLTDWAADDDEDLAACAMALVVARGHGRDRFGQPGLTLADCPTGVATQLVHAVAATLAAPDEADASATAANALLAHHDESARPEALEALLVRRLEAAGRLDPDLLLTLARHGEAGLLAEAAARLSHIPGADSWDLLTTPYGRGLPLLLRLAAIPRLFAAMLLGDRGEAFAIPDAAFAIDRFDALDDAPVEAERQRLRRPAAFRAAQAALDHG